MKLELTCVLWCGAISRILFCLIRNSLVWFGIWVKFVQQQLQCCIFVYSYANIHYIFLLFIHLRANKIWNKLTLFDICPPPMFDPVLQVTAFDNLPNGDLQCREYTTEFSAKLQESSIPQEAGFGRSFVMWMIYVSSLKSPSPRNWTVWLAEKLNDNDVP